MDNEDAMRFIVAASVFGIAAWTVMAILRWGATRLVAGRPRRTAAGTWRVVGAAGGGALLGRDHLPRFLISLPSETTAGGGVGPEIFNTIYFAVLSTAITLPIGVGAAVYLARFAASTRFVGIVRIALDTLASLPSIVYGLFGFSRVRGRG